MFDYGCWITHTGEIIDINEGRHSKYLEDTFGTFDVDRFERNNIGDMYAIAWHYGWIRVVWKKGGRCVAIEFQSTAPKAAQACIKLCRTFWKEERAHATFYINARVEKTLPPVVKTLSRSVNLFLPKPEERDGIPYREPLSARVTLCSNGKGKPDTAEGKSGTQKG